MNTATSTLDEVQAKIVGFLTDYGIQIIGALIILAIGALIARWIGRKADQWFSKRRIEPPIRILTVRVIRLLIFGLAVVLALDKFGVPITPMIAGISVAGVGIGLAMQGVLGNLMAGLTIIFTKPFRVGEFIEVVGVSGQVQAVELFTTTLLHSDRSCVVVPNRKLVGEILHNYGQIRQLDLTVGVAYGTNIDQVLALVREILQAHPRVLKDPAPVLGISALAESSISLSIKPWTTVPDFGPAQAELYQTLLEQFRAARIEIPFPQREVRMLNRT
ncbi:MAG: mechanosensitive ion channel family protein [Verrucomicrobiota bacterium]